MRLTPSYFFFQFTSVCNSRCETCSMWKLPPETIPPEVVERMGLFIDPAGVRSVYLTGGEPLFVPSCVAVAEVLNRWKPGVSIISSTNGIAPDLYLPRVRAMLEAGVHIRFQVSLNGLPATHDRSRGIPGNHDSAVRMALGLKELGALASLNILFQEGMSGADLSHVSNLAASLGVPCWSSPILRHNGWFGEEDDGARVPVIQNCRGGTDAITIRYNGDITACQEDRDFLVFGNLRDDGLDQERVASVQEAVRQRWCQPCGCCTNAFSEGMYVS